MQFSVQVAVLSIGTVLHVLALSRIKWRFLNFCRKVLNTGYVSVQRKTGLVRAKFIKISRIRITLEIQSIADPNQRSTVDTARYSHDFMQLRIDQHVEQR